LFASKRVLLFVLGVVVASCRNDAQDVKKIRSVAKGPSSIQYGITVVYSDTSTVQWRLKARELEEVRTGGQTEREVFRGDVSAVQLLQGKPTGRSLTADQIVRDVRKQKWFLTGGVAVRQGARKSLRTESLEWDRSSGKILGSQWVEINDEGQILSGTGFEAMEDLSVYTIFEVSGQFDEQTPKNP
jgi:hypothetical protein